MQLRCCLFARKQRLLFESPALFEGVNIIRMGVNIVRMHKVGYRKTNYQEEYAKEISLLKKNVSLRDCQSLTGTSINTLRKLKSMFVK